MQKGEYVDLTPSALWIFVQISFGVHILLSHFIKTKMLPTIWWKIVSNNVVKPDSSLCLKLGSYQQRAFINWICVLMTLPTAALALILQQACKDWHTVCLGCRLPRLYHHRRQEIPLDEMFFLLSVTARIMKHQTVSTWLGSRKT